MKEWIGKKVKISHETNGKTFFYTGKIIEVSDTHITFIDKFGTKYSKRISEVDLEEVNE